MLGQVLPQEAFGFLLIFVRLGAMIMVLPALGENTIPVRIRIALIGGLSLLIYGIVRESLPGIPASPLALAGLVVSEVLIGVMVGGVARLMMSALHVAGTIIGFQGGLAAAQHFDPNQGVQGALLSSFLSILGVTLIFATELHHLLIAAMRDSYFLFPATQAAPVADFATLALDTVAKSFKLGVQLSAPFIVYGLMFNIGLGIIARLMPQLPVFFIGMPANILIGFIILMFVLSSIMGWYLMYFEDEMTNLLGG